MIWKIIFATLVVLLGVGTFAWRKPSVARVTRVFTASNEAVWNLWNDPEAMKRWWGPHGFSCPLAQNDPRVGGRYLLGMQQEGSSRIDYNVGTYTEVVPKTRMVSLLSFSDEHGTPIPGARVRLPGTWPDAVKIEFDFEPVSPSETRVTITETGIPLILKLGAQMGWKQQFEKMDALLKR